MDTLKSKPVNTFISPPGGFVEAGNISKINRLIRNFNEKRDREITGEKARQIAGLSKQKRGR